MKDAFSLQKTEAMNRFMASAMVGDVDEGMLPLLEKINSLHDYYTTSSCAGRISVSRDFGSKRSHVFLGKWHERVDAREVLSCVKPDGGFVWFRMEPPIIHVVCKSLEAAARMGEAAFSSGFKRTGLQSFREGRFLLEILSTEKIEAPIIADNKKLVSDGYIIFLAEIANKKLDSCAGKLGRLEEKICGF